MSEYQNVNLHNNKDEPLAKRKQIIVIGAGPVAIKFSTEVLKQSNQFDIHIFSNEPFEPYNKKKLSAWLAGQTDRASLEMDLTQLNACEGFHISHIKIETIITRNKCVLDKLGDEHPYDYLVLATGARANIPNIAGVNLKGVYTFRNLKDAEHLYARLARSRNVVVVGAGLSGIQTAINLKKYNTHVILIEQGAYLMPRHLDKHASRLIQNELNELNITLSFSASLHEIIGPDQVSAVRLLGNKLIECDTVILCTGIKSNIELARQSNLAIGDGVIVNDQLKASNQSIFAIGGCLQHRGKTYGALSAGLQQADVAASVICNQESSYLGTKVINKMQIGHLPILSMGEIQTIKKLPQSEILIYQNKKKQCYRKLVLVKQKLIGVIAVGQWDSQQKVIECYEAHKRLNYWQRFKFKYTGNI